MDALTIQPIEPLVLILMGTLNGEKYIRDQLDSIALQSHQNWKLILSDDGSTDKTLDIARNWAAQFEADRVVFKKGPRKGSTQNFLSMACNSDLRADFYAFADQDDIWHRDKLGVAVSWAKKNSENSPFLYCGRTSYARNDLLVYAQSPLFQKPPTFRNALVQSIAGGNTMLFNREAKQLLEAVGVVSAVLHDWWLYQLVTGAGGIVLYDPQPYLIYRQHEDSLIGANDSWIARVKRLEKNMCGQFKRHCQANLLALRQAFQHLKPEHRKTLQQFESSRRDGLLKRLINLIRSGVHRQTVAGNLGLIALATLKKI